MSAPSGTFRNGSTTLTIQPGLKELSDLVSPSGQVAATNIFALLNRMTTESSGKCVMSREGMSLTFQCTFSKNILTVTDSTGTQTLFCYQFDKLFTLDPNAEMVQVFER